jgi:hypothetical protein
MTILDRDAILDGLKELGELAAAAGIASTIFILGGSAVALIEGSQRRTTTDIDSYIRSSALDRTNLFGLIEQIAQRRRWPGAWLNTAAEQFLPDAEQEPIIWVPILEFADFKVLCAPAPLLLAMKLRSNRGRRDTSDLPVLLAATGVAQRRDVEIVFATYFPHDGISPKCKDWLDNNGYPAEIEPPEATWSSLAIDRSDQVYIETYLRNGEWIAGHWRKSGT